MLLNPVFTPKDNYSSCRRWYLDAFLTGTAWRGKVLDIGGKKEAKRGSFRPPLDQVEAWEYVNIDPKTNPDFLAPAEALPVADATYDMVLLSEVLEHLAEPEKALAEAFRVLKPGGILVCAAPLLYPLHADPDDYQRWLPSRYSSVLSNIGFCNIKIAQMGGVFASVHDLVQLSSRYWLRGREGIKAKFVSFLSGVACRLLYKLSGRYPDFFPQATTGYYVIANK